MYIYVVSQKGRCGSLLAFWYFGFLLSVCIIIKKIQASKQSEFLDTILQVNCIYATHNLAEDLLSVCFVIKLHLCTCQHSITPQRTEIINTTMRIWNWQYWGYCFLRCDLFSPVNSYQCFRWTYFISLHLQDISNCLCSYLYYILIVTTVPKIFF